MLRQRAEGGLRVEELDLLAIARLLDAPDQVECPIFGHPLQVNHTLGLDVRRSIVPRDGCQSIKDLLLGHRPLRETPFDLGSNVKF